jgi:zinc finger protein
MDTTSKDKWTAFFGQLTAAINGEVKFTITLEDPLASSYVQSFAAPDPDPQMKVEEYDRTAEEEEELGLTDMKTEGYEEGHAADVAAAAAAAANGDGEGTNGATTNGT